MITIEFTQSMLMRLLPNVQKASIGGKSNIRKKKERKLLLTRDQWLGQIGEAGLSIWFSGDLDLYFKTRNHKNKNPTLGDDGCDLLGYPVDVKASNAKYKNLNRYHLLVPEEEMHNTIYVLGLVKKRSTSVILHLMGWATKKMVMKNYSIYGEFKFKYYLKCDELNSMKTCKDAIIELKSNR